MAGNRREQQAEERRTQLIDIALELFSQRGIEATRVSDIARHAGVSQGLLYHYFPSKATLLAAIIERYGPLQLLSELLATPPDRPARETLINLGLRIYAFVQERRPLIQLVMREVIWQPGTRAIGMAVREAALGMIAAYLQCRVEAGELRPHDPLVVGQTFASSVLLVAVAQLPAEPYIPGAVDVILQGIAVQRVEGAAVASETTGG